jgi:ATP-dependent DNA helicase RecQ
VEHVRQKGRYILDYVKEHDKDSGIIYCATRKNVEAVQELLSAEGIPATRYHAGLSAEERQRNQDDFIYDRKPVIVATNAFGMGIDKSNVRYVLHYNMPQSMENYYQEAGRGGRDGERSECILLYSPQDLMVNRFLLESKEMNPEFSYEEAASVRERDEQRLQAMNFYCNTTECLRTYILRYFGENRSEPCGHCGNCEKEFIEKDVTEEARTILQCIEEQHQRYGINVITGTLLGGRTAKLREYNVERYQTFGALSKLREAEIKEIIGQMVREGLLRQTNDKYALVKLTEDSGEILRGERRLILKTVKEAPETETRQSTGRVHAARKSDILNSMGLECFDVLRELRSTIAREESLPPYVIFSDKTLVDLCVRLPMNRQEMLKVSGVGEVKFEKYGERFLDCLRQYTGGERKKLYFGDEPESMQQSTKRMAKKEKEEFAVTDAMFEQLHYSEGAYLGDFVAALNDLRDEQSMKRLTVKEIQEWLQQEGYTAKKFANGHLSDHPTEKGEQLGITLGTRLSAKGHEYETLCYGVEMQKVIVKRYRKAEE